MHTLSFGTLAKIESSDDLFWLSMALEASQMNADSKIFCGFAKRSSQSLPNSSGSAGVTRVEFVFSSPFYGTRC